MGQLLEHFLEVVFVDAQLNLELFVEVFSKGFLNAQALHRVGHEDAISIVLRQRVDAVAVGRIDSAKNSVGHVDAGEVANLLGGWHDDQNLVPTEHFDFDFVFVFNGLWL